MASSVIPSEHAKKTEALKELRLLRIQADKFDKEKKMHIYNKHGDFYADFANFQEIELKMAQERNVLLKAIQQQLDKIKSQVRKFQREVKEVKPTPEFVEKLKVILEDIDTQMNTFKEKQRSDYEALVQEEQITNLEITGLEKRFESWAIQQNNSAKSASTTKPSSLPSHRDVHNNLPPEVTVFERFVQQSGGPRGGWDEYDHGTFIKYYNRHKGKPSFIRDLLGSLPTKTEQDVREHRAWYEEYLRLNEVKKEAIVQWREQKQLDKETARPTSGTDEEEEEERKRMKSRQEEEQRSEVKHQLSRWKVEKELEKAEQEERRLREEAEKLKRAEADKQRKLEQRRLVEEHRALRAEQEEQRRVEEAVRRRVEGEQRQTQARVIISRLQTRDLDRVKNKRSKRQQAELEQEQEKQQRLDRLRSRVQVSVDRDPSRLLQPTKGWLERQKDTETSGEQLLHMPHRAVPSWRQNIH